MFRDIASPPLLRLVLTVFPCLVCLQHKESESEAKKQASLLFQIPLELRAEIYSQIFFSTRLTHGEKHIDDVKTIRVLPSPNGLALLRTCHRVREEIGNSWLGQVLFNFEHSEGLLDTLSMIPHETLQKIRHLRIRGNPHTLTYPGAEDAEYHRLLSVLKPLPGLRLDRLTVLGFPIPLISYAILNQLVLESDGWKERRYISHDSTILGYPKAPIPFIQDQQDDQCLRNPQPAHWREVLERRDGRESAPSVTIYRGQPITPSLDGSVLDIDKRELYEQSPPEDAKGLEEYGRKEDPKLMADAHALFREDLAGDSNHLS